MQGGGGGWMNPCGHWNIRVFFTTPLKVLLARKWLSCLAKQLYLLLLPHFQLFGRSWWKDGFWLKISDLNDSTNMFCHLKGICNLLLQGKIINIYGSILAESERIFHQKNDKIFTATEVILFLQWAIQWEVRSPWGRRPANILFKLLEILHFRALLGTVIFYKPR